MANANADEWKFSVIPGAKELFEWFGYWPSFHDAEVIEIYLHRKQESWLSIHTCRANLRADHYEFDKHVVVTFKFHDIQALELEGFNNQNAMSSVDLKKIDDCMELELFGLHGLSGLIRAKNVSIELTPGQPQDVTSSDS